MSDNEDAIWLDYLMGYADALEADSSKKDQQFRLIQAIRTTVTLAKNQATGLTELRRQFENSVNNHQEEWSMRTALRDVLREIYDLANKNKREQKKWIKDNASRMKKLLEG